MTHVSLLPTCSEMHRQGCCLVTLELGLKGVDLGAEIAGQGPGCVFLEVERLKEGVEVHAPTTCGSRQVSVRASVSRRAMTWVMAQ